MSRTYEHGAGSRAASERAREARRAYARLWRNFWGLVAAAVVAAGVVSAALRLPSGPAVGALTAVSGVAALTALALAGRILVVVTGAVTARRAGPRGVSKTRRR